MLNQWRGTSIEHGRLQKCKVPGALIGSLCFLKTLPVAVTPMTPPSATPFESNTRWYLQRKRSQPDSHWQFASAARFQQHKQLDRKYNQPAATECRVLMDGPIDVSSYLVPGAARYITLW